MTTRRRPPATVWTPSSVAANGARAFTSSRFSPRASPSSAASRRRSIPQAGLRGPHNSDRAAPSWCPRSRGRRSSSRSRAPLSITSSCPTNCNGRSGASAPASARRSASPVLTAPPAPSMWPSSTTACAPRWTAALAWSARTDACSIAATKPPSETRWPRSSDTAWRVWSRICCSTRPSTHGSCLRWWMRSSRRDGTSTRMASATARFRRRASASARTSTGSRSRPGTTTAPRSICRIS